MASSFGLASRSAMSRTIARASDLKLSLGGRKRLGREAREAHQVDAIAGVDGVLVRTGEPLGDESHDRARFVKRPGGADADAAHGAVDAIEAELDAPRALGLPLEQHDEI